MSNQLSASSLQSVNFPNLKSKLQEYYEINEDEFESEELKLQEDKGKCKWIFLNNLQKNCNRLIYKGDIYIKEIILILIFAKFIEDTKQKI